MKQIFLIMVSVFLITTNGTYAFAGGTISVTVVDKNSEANRSVYITDSPPGYGETIYITERPPGYGKTFYITDDSSNADIIFKKPPEGPQSADLRLFIFTSPPGYGETIYITDSPPGYGKTIYFANSNPGYGKAVYVEDPLLRFNKRLIAVMLLLLGAL